MKGSYLKFMLIAICYLFYTEAFFAQPLGILCLEENFDDSTGAFPPNGWCATGVNRTTAAGSCVSAPAAANFNSYNGELILPQVSNPTLLTFKLGRTNHDTVKYMIVEISTCSNCNGFIPLDTFSNSHVPFPSFASLTVNLSGWINESAIWIRFRKKSTTTSPWRIDDVKVYNYPPLPVNLLSFKATPKDNNTVSISWETAAEDNNAGFSIESSADGWNYTPLGFIQGAGTTSYAQRYTFVDDSPWPPVTYYKLVQRDLNGREQVLKVIECRINSPCQKIDVTNLSVTSAGIGFTLGGQKSGLTRIEVMSISGQRVYSDLVAIPEEHNFFINLKLLQGIYVLIVSNTHTIITRKFLFDF